MALRASVSDLDIYIPTFIIRRPAGLFSRCLSLRSGLLCPQGPDAGLSMDVERTEAVGRRRESSQVPIWHSASPSFSIAALTSWQIGLGCIAWPRDTT
jgi:hypothetical protein